MEPDMEPDTFPDELIDALAGLRRSLRRRLRPQLTPQLRGAEIELLRLVVDHPGVGVSEAAKELHLAGNSVSTLVNQLSRQGYLVRETDPADRRAARLTPAPAAATRLDEWRTRRSELVRSGLSRLGETDREALGAAIPALRKLADHLHEEAEES